MGPAVCWKILQLLESAKGEKKASRYKNVVLYYLEAVVLKMEHTNCDDPIDPLAVHVDNTLLISLTKADRPIITSPKQIVVFLFNILNRVFRLGEALVVDDVTVIPRPL